MLKGALVGFGKIAESAHAPAFRARPGLEIVAVTDASAGRLALASKILPGVRAYDSFEELLSREAELDFAVIATPPASHERQITQALEKGLHVLCEKPLALNKEEFLRIAERAATSGRCVFGVHNWAYAPIWRKVWELLPSLGPVRHAELRVLRTQPAASAMPGDWRRDPRLAGGGILVDHGWHNLYLLRRLLDLSAADAASAEASFSLSGAPADDAALALLKFRESTGFLHLTWKAAERRNTAFAMGERGTIEIDDDVLLLRLKDAPERRWSFPEKLSAGSAHPEWLAALLPDFEREAREPALRGRSLDEAAFVVEIISRAYSRAEALA